MRVAYIGKDVCCVYMLSFPGCFLVGTVTIRLKEYKKVLEKINIKC